MQRIQDSPSTPPLQAFAIILLALAFPNALYQSCDWLAKHLALLADCTSLQSRNYKNAQTPDPAFLCGLNLIVLHQWNTTAATSNVASFYVGPPAEEPRRGINRVVILTYDWFHRSFPCYQGCFRVYNRSDSIKRLPQGLCPGWVFWLSWKNGF
jgi:hypothetical protein